MNWKTRTLIVVATLCLASVTLHADSRHAAGTKAAASQSSDGTGTSAASGVVNITSATVDQLALLPRIGPSKANTIINFRTKHPFKTTADLMRIKGIGRKTYAMLKPYLTVSGATTLTEKPKLAAKE